MRFNGKILEVPATEHKQFYLQPKLQVGDKIEFLASDEENYVGGHNIKKGRYIIVQVRPSWFTKVKWLNTYVFLSDRMNAKYDHSYCTGAIDKLIDMGIVRVIK
jgi:hypothetical protein